MKKLITAILLAAMLISLVACGGNTGTESSDSDSHTESDSRHHDDTVLPQKPCLIFGSNGMIQTSMIRQCRYMLFRQKGNRFFHLASGQTIDDTGLSRMPRPDEIQQLSTGVFFLDDDVTDIRTIEG